MAGQGQSGQAIKLFQITPTSMISKHSTIPVPDSLLGASKNQFYLPFFDTSLSFLMTWNLQSYPTTVLN